MHAVNAALSLHAFKEGEVTAAMLLEAAKQAGVELDVEKEVRVPLLPGQGPLTHNGIFTVHSARTGEHRTFRVRTQDAEARFAPGKRVVSLLTGPDNTSNYTQFAFVEDSKVQVWERMRGGKYDEYARMLEKLVEHVNEGKCRVLAACRCRVCNRTLTTPESVTSGIGPICGGRS